MCSRNSPGRDKLELYTASAGENHGAVFSQGPEAKHHQRKVSDLVRASQSSSKRRFERTMKTFNHTVALRMETDGLGPQDTVNRADLQPNGGHKLSSMVQGEHSWNTVPGDPGRYESSGAGLNGNGGQRYSLGLSRGSVDHCQYISISLTGRQGPHQAQVNVGKSSF